MKRFSQFAAVAVLAAAPYLFADDRPASTAPQTRPADAPGRGERPVQARRERDGIGGERGLWRGPSTAAAYIEAMDPDAGLTEDQKKVIPGIFDARDKAIKDFETENAGKIKAASKAMEDAIQGRDPDAITKARQEYRETFGPMHEIMRKASEDLDNLLTADQKSKLAQARLVKSINAYVAPTQLTDEQMKKLVALAIAPDANPREPLQEKIGPALEQMLTPEQKAPINKRLAIAQVQRSMSRVRLTHEQYGQIDAAYDDLAKDASMTRESLVKALAEKVNGLLTEDQKQAIANDQSSRRADDQPRRPRGSDADPKPAR